MGEFLLGLGLGAFLFAVIFAVTVRRKAAHRPPPSPAAPETPGDPPIRDPFARDLYELQQRVLTVTRPAIPDEMLLVRGFPELVDRLSDSAVEVDRLWAYILGEDTVLHWACLVALARRPRDPASEERLLGWINGFPRWSRHFILRVLEAWNPDDPALAGRVLVRLDGSWGETGNRVILDDFLHRRAAIARPSLAGLERPRGFSAGTLRAVLAQGIDPALARPLIDELAEESDVVTEVPEEPDRTPSHPASEVPIPGIPSRLSQIGRVTRPGAATDEGLIGCPSADAQLERVLAAMTGAPSRSALVAGEAGVGKTTLARRAAARLSRRGWRIFEAGAGQIVAGTAFVGTLEQRIQAMRHQLARSRPILWSVPDFHQLLWSGRHLQSPTGVLEMIIPAIESGEIVMLGEVRPAALERVLIERPEVARLFEIVRLEPPPEAEISALLDEWAATATTRTHVQIPRDLRVEAAALARQYLSSQTPPGGVIGLLQRALARAGRSAARAEDGGSVSLTMDDLLGTLAQVSGLPLEILDERRTLDRRAVLTYFKSRVMGQPEAVRCLVDRLTLLKAGVTDPSRPTGVFLFAGGSGTGKTELAKTLAEYLFGSPDRLLRMDMSELQDPHALDRLLGSADPGVGGKSLAERVRRQPFSVVLLDEFDRAHWRVWDLFLQVFDDGRLTDHRGDTADFRQAIIILTSNLGTESWSKRRIGILSGGDVFSPAAVESAIQNIFRPEFLNRLDRQIVFQPLTREIMRQILLKELAGAREYKGLRKRGWAIELEESAIELLIERGFSPTFGARPLKRALVELLLTPLAKVIVSGRAPEGDQFLFVRADGDRLAVEFVDPDAPPDAPPPKARAIPRPGGTDPAAIVFEARGNAAEAEILRDALRELQARVANETWRAAKEGLLLEFAQPGFYDRRDRSERWGRAEYIDRIESSLERAASLLERLEGDGRAPRTSYPREMVRHLAQQLYLAEAACAEALDCGPRDAFVSVEPVLEGAGSPEAAREFARRLADMYVAWARKRKMKLTSLEPGDGTDEDSRVLAIAGFAAYKILAPENGLHVFQSGERGGRARSIMVRVRVEPQPPVPTHGKIDALRKQAAEAFRAPVPATRKVVRRYREEPTPLVRDSIRGWQTGRIERVLGGDFDVIPGRD